MKPSLHGTSPHQSSSDLAFTESQDIPHYASISISAEPNLRFLLSTGGPFDPLGLASGEKAAGLKEAEIKHARLAMVAFLGENAVPSHAEDAELLCADLQASRPCMTHCLALPSTACRLLRAGILRRPGRPRLPGQVRRHCLTSEQMKSEQIKASRSDAAG